MREGSMDVFPRTANVPHLEQLCILFWGPFNTLFLRLQRCLMYLGMCSSLVMGRNLCRRLLTRTDVQCFGINRYVKLFRDRWQCEFKIVRHIIPDLGAFC